MHRVVERAADSNVRERPLVGDDEPLRERRRARRCGDAGEARGAYAVVRVEVPGRVDVAAREPVDPLLLPHDRQANAVDGGALGPVIDVALEHDLAARLVADHAVRAGADRRA
jgi:hypothetical protein